MVERLCRDGSARRPTGTNKSPSGQIEHYTVRREKHRQQWAGLQGRGRDRQACTETEGAYMDTKGGRGAKTPEGAFCLRHRG